MGKVLNCEFEAIPKYSVTSHRSKTTFRDQSGGGVKSFNFLHQSRTESRGKVRLRPRPSGSVTYFKLSLTNALYAALHEVRFGKHSGGAKTPPQKVCANAHHFGADIRRARVNSAVCRWNVRVGRAATHPIHTALALILSVLGVLGFMRRRKQRA